MGSVLLTSMLERCAQVLEEVIIPELSTNSYALMQARYIVLYLHVIAPAVEEKSKELAEENRAMREALEKVAMVLREQQPLSPGVNQQIEKIDHRLQKDGSEQLDLSEENRLFRETLTEVIKGLDALRSAFPDEAWSSLRQHIRVAARKELDRYLARAGQADHKTLVTIQ